MGDTTDWVSGWRPGTVPPIAYSWMPGDEGEWTRAGTGFEQRELGLVEASKGLIAAVELRPDGQPVAADWVTNQADVAFLFVLAGSAKLTLPDGVRELTKWSSATLLRRGCYILSDVSADFRAIDIRVPDSTTDTAGSANGSWSGSVNDEADDQYVLANGPRSYFDYRDLQTRVPTEQRMHIHVVRATQAVAGGTGWHVHTMSQWFWVLRGNGIIRVEGKGDLDIKAGDCMCLGVGMKHDVSEFSDDYMVLEMCLPAEYETEAVEPS